MKKTDIHGAILVGSLALACTLSAGMAQAQESRNACLMHSQIEDMIQLDDNQLVLIVDGGTTVYLLELDRDCFSGQVQRNLSLRPTGSDGCVRTTDTVVYGRRDCRIRDFSLVETQDQLDDLLASLE